MAMLSLCSEPRAGSEPERPRVGPGRPLVVLCAGETLGSWNGESPERRGVGGSETAVVRLAEALVRNGMRVVVYCPCGDAEGVTGGVEYFDIRRLPELAAADVLIVSRHAPLLEQPVRAARRYLWVHDSQAIEAESEEGDLVRRHSERLDAIVCVSDWQREVLAAYHGVGTGRMIVIPNAIEPRLFSSRVPRQRHRFVYSSCPSRGLDTLLELFPRIRSRFPDAELHVFHGFEYWNLALLRWSLDAELWGWRNSIRASLKQPGVVFHGRVGQPQLALEMRRSEIWFHPTHHRETYCITALEAQMAGAVCVTSDLAALQTTVGDRGILIPGDAYTEEYRERALAEVFAILEDHERRRRLTVRARRWAARQTWDRRALEWMALFQNGA